MAENQDIEQNVNRLLAALRWSREEERHEIGWIGHRLGWLLVSQSFLISAVVVTHANSYRWWYGIVVAILLGMLGIWLSTRSLFAIQAAQTIIDRGWLSKASQIYKQAGSSLDYTRINRPLHSIGYEDKNTPHDVLHIEALKLHMNIGWAFLLVWIVIVMIGIVNGIVSSGKFMYLLTDQFKYKVWVLFISSVIVVMCLMVSDFIRTYFKVKVAKEEVCHLPQATQNGGKSDDANPSNWETT